MRTFFINLAIRGLVKRRLAACQTPLDVRRAFSSASPIKPRGVRFSEATLGNISGEWAECNQSSENSGTLLYVHGGGYVAMSPRTHRAITGGFAQRGFRVFCPDYRLAPEHKFPAAVDDMREVWHALRKNVEGPIYLAGDSSGGGLCVALLLDLRDRGESSASGACLFSPWTDLAATGASIISNCDRDPMQVPKCFQMLAIAYAGTTDLRTPLVSPIYGDFTGLPPMLIFVGDTEVLLDDARRLAELASLQGVDARLRIYPNMPHAWPLLSAIMPEGRRALDECSLFLKTAAVTSPTPSIRRGRPQAA